jgi:hypothetical protein
MMNVITERIFNRRYQRGMGLWANFLMGGMTLVGFFAMITLALPFLILLGPGAAAVGSVLAGITGGIMGLWAGLDRFGLLGNHRLRRSVEQKLESLAELPFDPRNRNVRFVGLSHPCREGLLRWETDDDVGFLEVSPEGLRYRGDALSFDVPAEDLVAVELVPVGGFMPRSLKRVRVTLRDGEPFDEINFDSRNSDRYFTAQRDTYALYHKLRALVRQPGREPAVVEAGTGVSVSTEEVPEEAEEEVAFHLTEDVVEWEEGVEQEVRAR